MPWYACLALTLLVAGCGADRASPDGPPPVRLTVAAYTVVREVLNEEHIPAFRAWWRDRTGQDVSFETSFQASGAQSRAVAGGLEADVVLLSLEDDVTRLVDAGLVTHDWKGRAVGGMVSRSLVVLAVRPGNPAGVTDWGDLARPGVEVITPNPKTSGGAMWNVLGAYGAAARGRVPGFEGDAGAEQLLGAVLRNVRVMDKSGRDSILTFEKGVGDVAVTYENEVVAARRAGRPLDVVIPSSTVLIENPGAVVDAYADRHGVREVADAFLAFLVTAEAQRAYARHGLRAVIDGVETPDVGTPGDVFRVDELGGWVAVKARVFDDGALYDRASARARASR